MHTQAQTLLSSPAFQGAKQTLLKTIHDHSEQLRQRAAEGLSASRPELKAEFEKTIQEFTRLRGRDLYFPFIASGLGAGPYVELVDGSIKLDLITGIGVNFFGHSHPKLMEELIDAVPSDVMQGNLEPGVEASALLSLLVQRAGRQSKLSHGWLTTCGTMANEIALKIIRQKRAPATKVLALSDCFAGRSTAMQEITDNPKYRDGQPVYGEAHYLPAYEPALSADQNVERAVGHAGYYLDRYPGKFAAMMAEIVQGEGGFLAPPKAYFAKLFEFVKSKGLAVWVDEVQTFGRTGELFAFEKWELGQWVDVVTVAKMLQASAVLYTSEYNPKPGLVAGTFTGSSGQLRASRRSLEILESEGFLGPNGKIEKLSKHFVSRLEALKKGSCKGKIGDIRATGAMIAFVPNSGSADDVKAVVMKLFDLGVIAFTCGHGPYLVRMLPPFGAMSEVEIDLACSKIESALLGRS